MPYYICSEGHLSYTAATGVGVACARCGRPSDRCRDRNQTGEDARPAERRRRRSTAAAVAERVPAQIS